MSAREIITLLPAPLIAKYFGKDAFKLLKGDNKQLVIVPGANHTDLYDGGPDRNIIPWDTVNNFFKTYLK